MSNPISSPSPQSSSDVVRSLSLLTYDQRNLLIILLLLGLIVLLLIALFILGAPPFFAWMRRRKPEVNENHKELRYQTIEGWLITKVCKTRQMLSVRVTGWILSSASAGDGSFVVEPFALLRKTLHMILFCCFCATVDHPF